MKAVPTRFNDVLYRSKSEARLAVCFQEWGWRFEYEPKINSMPWFKPDFLIAHGSNVFRVIEYKPIKPTYTYLKSLSKKFTTLFFNNRNSGKTIRCELWCIDFFSDSTELFSFDSSGKMTAIPWIENKSIQPGLEFRFDLHEHSLAKVDISKIVGGS